MVTLAYTDNGDGDGGVFHVTGYTGTVTIWVSRFDGSNAKRTFFPLSMTGGTYGASNSDIPVGCYIAHAVDNRVSSVVISPPISFQSTDSGLSLYEQIAIAIRQYVLGLALPGIETDPDKHVIAKVGAKLNELLRLGEDGVYYIPSGETYDGGDNTFSSVSYPVNVVFVKKSGSTVKAGLSNLLVAREGLNLAFSSTSIPDLPAVNNMDVQPGPVVDPSQWAQGLDVSVLKFICYSEQLDGLLP